MGSDWSFDKILIISGVLCLFPKIIPKTLTKD